MNRSFNMISYTQLIVMLMLLAVCMMSNADDAALYDKAPKGSSFIRVISLSTTPMSVRLGDRNIQAQSYCSASEFLYLPAGQYSQTIGDISWSGEFEEDGIYSLVISDAEIWLLKEPKATHSRKGVLAVYNFSDYQSISVRTSEGGRLVFRELPKGQLVYRQVNPIKIGLSAYADEQRLHDSAPVIFQTRVLSSLFICGQEKSLESHWAMY
jgi:hypothetical protein